MINLELSTEEVNVILNALSARPYNEVAALITKIFETAQAELKKD